MENIRHEEFVFNDINQALGWATEVLRCRQFPKLSQIYKEMHDDESAVNMAYQKEAKPATFYGQLPATGDEKFGLAIKVYEVLGQVLNEDEIKLVKLALWGDYASTKRQHAAQMMQEKMRKLGKYVRLSWRYSYRQLGAVYNVDHKTAKRRLDKALAKLEAELQARGLVYSYQQKAS